MAVIREGNYTHNLFNGPQVQQRREAHKDPDQGGLLLHRREQEVQEHISEFRRRLHKSSGGMHVFILATFLKVAVIRAECCIFPQEEEDQQIRPQ